MVVGVRRKRRIHRTRKSGLVPVAGRDFHHAEDSRGCPTVFATGRVVRWRSVGNATRYLAVGSGARCLACGGTRRGSRWCRGDEGPRAANLPARGIRVPRGRMPRGRRLPTRKQFSSGTRSRVGGTQGPTPIRCLTGRAGVRARRSDGGGEAGPSVLVRDGAAAGRGRGGVMRPSVVRAVGRAVGSLAVGSSAVGRWRVGAGGGGGEGSRAVGSPAVGVGSGFRSSLLVFREGEKNWGTSKGTEEASAVFG